MQLADAVAAVEDEQKYMWARERASRDSTYCCCYGSPRSLLRVAATRCRILTLLYPRLAPRCAANESTNSRVVWFAVMELVTMVCVGVFQVYYLRRFMERKAKY